MVSTPWLSENIVGMSIEVLTSLNSCNQTRASREASDSDIYSASMVESATVLFV